MSDSIQLFAAQKRIYPRDVWGRYRKLKWLVMAVLLAIYYLAPWIRWDRGPHTPDQALLIDMPARRAYFFFVEIWPQEVFYITGLLILAAVALFFVTSLFGRVWCGYACPQTVWTDLFIKVEHWIQGDRNARIKRDNGPWTIAKIWRKALTHMLWILIGLCTGGAWVFYFNDAPTLVDQILHCQVPWNVGAWILGLTASTYIMAGYAREQVCTYMCPYARFQSAMFDKDTLIIGYDSARGEPRGSHKLGDSWNNRGHCIDCNQCVVVCPTGIDIRDGLQMPCIACGLCVDACNGVMDKIGLPRGLIRYDTERNQAQRMAAKTVQEPFVENLRLLRPRTLYYLAFLVIVGSGTLFGILTRAPSDMHILHDRNPLFVQLSTGDIRNCYTIKILNKTHEDQDYQLSLKDLPGATMKIEASGTPDPNHLTVLADSVGQFRALVTLPPTEDLFRRKDIEFELTDNATHVVVPIQSMFVTGK